VTPYWFVKARRAQNQDDDETWKRGGVTTTLNAFDNGGESRATVLIVYAFDSLSSNSMKSKNPNSGSREITVAKTLDTTNGDPSKNQGGMAVLIIDGTRVDDVRVTDDEIMQTVIQRWGTGGGNVPAIAYSIREDAKANNFSATEIEQARALQALQPSVQSHHAQTFIAEPLQVRRLTPMECERLQGFPDNWTASQSDSQRYRQMGNAVTVNVIESIGECLE
jgi:DNA (cytosine-5)-methyltransferase 1